MNQPSGLGDGGSGPDDGWSRLTPVRTRPTRRALVHLLLGGFLYLSGANVSAGWVVVLAGLLLGSVPWAWLQARRAARSVAVRRRLPRDVTAGVPTPVVLEVRARTTAVAVVADELTGATGVAGGLTEGAELTAAVRFRRGQVRGGPVHLHVSDLFGLVDVRVAGEVPADLRVRPASLPLPAAWFATPWATEAGQAGVRVGHGSEVVGVRDHQRGDPTRAVHWRATARRGHLVVRELADPAQARMRLELAASVWDAGALDRACEVVCAVATRAHVAGHAVTVAVDGDASPWSSAVRDRLAVLPPHLGAAPRRLAPVPPAPADVTLALAPAGVGVGVTLSAGEGIRSLGVLPGDAGPEQVREWLEARLGRRPAAGPGSGGP